MSSKGYFIVFEGIDGCGKSTQVSLLYDYLVGLGYNVIKTREPGGCQVSNKIRELLLDSDNEIMPSTEVYLFAASRAQQVRDTIRPALAAGKIVICDRFVDSSIAYQGVGRGFGVETVKQINALAVDGCYPDRTFLLEINPAIAAKRLVCRDRIEQLGIGFFKSVSDGFIRIANNNQNYTIMDGESSVEALRTRINEVVIVDLEKLKVVTLK